LGAGTLVVSGAPAGSDSYVQYNNSSALGGDSGFTYNDTDVRVTISGVGLGTTGALHITRGDGALQYIVMQESASAPDNVYLTFKGSGGNAIAMGATFSAGSPTEYVFTDIAGATVATINATTGKITVNGTMNVGGETASRILSTDGSSDIKALNTATYPSLTELAYVKGVTSALQTQLNARLINTATSGVGATPTASSTTTITHGLGRTPVIIRISGKSGFTSNAAATPTTSSEGRYTSSGNACVYQGINGTTTIAAASSTAFAVFLDTSAGNSISGVIGNLTATTFDIVWTETGTHTRGVYMWEAQ